MNKRWILPALLLICALLLGGCAGRQSDNEAPRAQTNCLIVTVALEDVDLSAAELRAVPTGDGESIALQSVQGMEHTYTADVPAGSYRVMFSLPGFEPVSLPMKVESEMVNQLTLRPTLIQATPEQETSAAPEEAAMDAPAEQNTQEDATSHTDVTESSTEEAASSTEQSPSALDEMPVAVDEPLD